MLSDLVRRWPSSITGTDARRRLAAVAAAAGLVLALQRLWRRWRSYPRNVPVAPGHWLLGNLPSFALAVRERTHYDWSLNWHKLLGRTFALKFPLTAWWVVTSDPANVEHILKTNFENYPKGELVKSRLTELLGRGIFNVDGEEWHSQRKTASKMFTASLFKEHIWVVVRRNARKLRDVMLAAEPGTPLDVFNLMNRFTLDTIGEIGFGKCIGSLEDPTSPFLRSFDKSQQISFRRFYVPLWRPLRWLGIGCESETREHFGRLDEYSRSVVRELRSGMEDGAAGAGAGGRPNSVVWCDLEARKSFLGLFLEDARRRNEELSEDFLRDLVLNFLIAGRDTTAQALSWTLFCLVTHPEAEARARKEICEVCGVRGPAYEDMNHLPYLQAVLSEALRLYPSVPWDIKICDGDDALPDGTYVPRGTAVLYDIYSIGRDTKLWGEDAMDYRPERWLEMEKAPGNYKYPVFNAGPRECLGRRLALVEMKTCLAMLLPQMSLKLAVPREEVKFDAQLTIGMSRGMPCFVTARTDAGAGEDRLVSSAASTTAQSDCTTAAASDLELATSVAAADATVED